MSVVWDIQAPMHTQILAQHILNDNGSTELKLIKISLSYIEMHNVLFLSQLNIQN
jgi:hypothetical protein